MSQSDDRAAVPDVDQLAQSMLALHGRHDDTPQSAGGVPSPSRPRPQAVVDDPQRAAAVREATRLDRERYLSSGLQPVDCRFCHATVTVKKLGPGHTAVQWNTEASQRCAYFTEVRTSGGYSARIRACPKLTDSIEHAVTEGCLEAISTASPPGDG
jgi:hypothetical protein